MGIVAAMAVVSSGDSTAQAPSAPPLQAFFDLASFDDRTSRAAADAIRPVWNDGYTAMVLDMARQLRTSAPAQSDNSAAEFEGSGISPDDDPPGGAGPPGGRSDFGGSIRQPPSRESLVRGRLVRFLERATGKRFDPQLRAWRTWMWSLPYAPHPDYAEFKGLVYSRIDRRMTRFFPAGVAAEIRLDEIDWGGVTVNGIPPLYYPKTVPATEADYLKDGHVVFGVVVNGEARAYPKRILAWHEMARDRVGGVELHVVYCTLCGTVIPYESAANNRTWRLGTSGLLYRSNKLMFDEETWSLWNTVEGKPVVGPLVGQGLVLKSRPVVTTTWGEWRRQHPGTTVLSLGTGHQRDYSEGAAYRDYFSHDNLYFQVPHDDRRLKNKAEVLTWRVRPVGEAARPVAVAQDRLRRVRVYPVEVAGQHFVVVTTRQGANRVFASGATPPPPFAAEPTAEGDVREASGAVWKVTEDRLEPPAGRDGALPRVSAQRAFWFGWRAQYPDTVLVQ